MIVISGSQFTYFDIDNTCVMWNLPKDYNGPCMELDPWPGEPGIKLAINQEMVEQMKKHKARGHTIVVWSQGGWAWAMKVVERLNLRPYVDLVVEKPTFLYDDLPSQAFMPKSQWVGPKEWLENE